jgi:hypothetical protein
MLIELATETALNDVFDVEGFDIGDEGPTTVKLQQVLPQQVRPHLVLPQQLQPQQVLTQHVKLQKIWPLMTLSMKWMLVTKVMTYVPTF